MNAIPRNVPGTELPEGLRYQCPLCRSQLAGDEADTGWVKCPLVGGRAICLGCCIDYQSVARSDDFEFHSYQELFIALARESGEAVGTLRRRCMQHQLEVIDEQLTETADDYPELVRLRTRIVAILSAER